jgi:NAD(P)-dependent dehydrogenase (short-subunit alcohol dehydrogenase family)
VERIALVTGANKGIGLEVCRQLAQRELIVILTSRDTQAGAHAVKLLDQDGLAIQYHQLDVADDESVARVKDYIQEQYGRLDVLVNNAGVFLDQKNSPLTIPLDVIRETMEVNYYGALRMCQAFIPSMIQAGYGRVINVSSGMGSLTEMGSGSLAYRTSKAALNAMTRVLATEAKGKDLKVNTMHPGWVRTDMGGNSATRDVKEGADTIVWLATLNQDGPSGGFFYDRKPMAW